MSEERSTGKVRWFNNLKGFGFIAPDDGGEDLFVHQSSIKSDGFRTLSENDEVEFVIVSGDNEKTKAVDVTGPNGAPLPGKGGKRDDGYPRKGGDRRNGGGGCYNCGGSGHLARDCPQEPASGVSGGRGGGGGGACFKCHEVGHIARDCSAENVGGGRGSCYNCSGFGHLARECPQSGGSGGGGSCYQCGEGGHFARECPRKSQGGGGAGGRAGGECYSCHKTGHFARDCPIASS